MSNVATRNVLKIFRAQAIEPREISHVLVALAVTIFFEGLEEVLGCPRGATQPRTVSLRACFRFCLKTGHTAALVLGVTEFVVLVTEQHRRAVEDLNDEVVTFDNRLSKHICELDRSVGR